MERGLLALRTLGDLDLRAVLLPILPRALQHVLVEFFFHLRGVLAGRASAAFGRADVEPLSAPVLVSLHVKVRLLRGLVDNLAVRATRGALFVLERLDIVFEFLGRARLLGHRARRVSKNLPRREWDRLHQVAHLVLLRNPRLAIREEQPEIDCVPGEDVEHVAAVREHLVHLGEERGQTARSAERIGSRRVGGVREVQRRVRPGGRGEGDVRRCDGHFTALRSSRKSPVIHPSADRSGCRECNDPALPALLGSRTRSSRSGSAREEC